MQILSLVAGYIICGLVGFLAIIVVWRIADGTIDISQLISEANGDASMSRFQFLVFTFVIALSLFLVIVGADKHPAFPQIPGTVLALLGISGSSYLVGKSIQFSDPAGLVPHDAPITVSPDKPNVRRGQTPDVAVDRALDIEAEADAQEIGDPAVIELVADRRHGNDPVERIADDP